ncbi:MAG TPA: SulP family inorganic anion transporter [Promineifilum sp.]|nr:SulP family inorganic anion transporter [Promineifilum sp.]HRO89082.1 SulP family inorganic anion transporter [Promineifilum sp.]HRQ12773.1 SulP family inorganic anion transporter [Promineifilum sp.]
MTMKSRLSPSTMDDIRNVLRPGQLFPILLAGGLIGILQIAIAASFGALIFSGEMATYLSRGIGMALFSAMLGLAITSLLTSYPAIMGGNQDSPAAIMGVMAAGIAGMVTGGEARLATVVVAVALTTLITGVFLFGLGTFRLAGLVRFLPYPVAGGFLAGTGWLLAVGGIGTMARRPFAFTDLPALFAADTLIYWLPGLILGAAILILSTRIRHYLFMPGMIIAIAAGFYLIAALAGMSPAELSAKGWLLGPFPQGRMWQPVGMAELSAVDWRAIWSQLPNLVTAVIISSIALLLNATGLELAFNRDIDLNREMRVAGLANMASGTGAGLTGFVQFSFSVLVERLGAANRLTGLLAAAVCGITLWFGGAALGFVPTVVFGALLVYLGLSFLWEWVVVARKRLPLPDYLVILLILIIIAAVGFLEGVLVGIIVTVVMFVVNYSRTSVVKHELNGTTFRSRVTRNLDDRAVLDALGDQAYILQLQGFVFFGTANGLLEQVRARTHRQPTRYIVLDFHQVIGLDSTALLSFDKMRQLARGQGLILVLSGLSERLRQQFTRGGIDEEPGVIHFAADIDRAAEWYEDQLCAANNRNTAERRLTAWLQDIVPGEATGRLVGYMERRDVAQGDHLIRQGAESEQLFFIESGQVTAQLENDGSPPVRLETMQGGRSVGELGFYLGTTRSAAVVVDRPGIIYSLSRESLNHIEQEDPEAAYAFHRIIVHLLGERVLHLVRTMDALQS